MTAVGIEDRFDHEHQLAATLAAVDHRRRVLRLGRDEADSPKDRLGHAIHSDAHLVAGVNDADPRFRDERTDLDVLGRQQRNHRPAGGDPFPWAVERVEDQTGLRRLLTRLREIPLGLGQCSFQGPDIRLGSRDLVAAGAEFRGFQFGLKLGDLLASLVASGTCAIQLLGSRRVIVDKPLLTEEFLFGKLQRRTSLLKLRRDRLDLRRAFALGQVFQARAGLRQSLDGLVTRCNLWGVLQPEQWLIRFHRSASHNVQSL